MPKYTPQNHIAPVDLPNQTLPTHLPHISDYESDSHGNVLDYPSNPPPPFRSSEELNLSVLQRHNKDIVRIISVAPYAVIYEFVTQPDPAWSKTGVEGSLFLCQLTPGLLGEERYVAIVLNRRGLNNFEAPLVEGENAGVEINDEYVIVTFKQGSEHKVYGVYIFSGGPGTSTEHTREGNAELMKNFAFMARNSRHAAEVAATDAQRDSSNGKIQQGRNLWGIQGPGGPLGEPTDFQYSVNQHQTQHVGFTPHSHTFDETATARTMTSGHQSYQTDAIADFFRKAGIGMTQR